MYAARFDFKFGAVWVYAGRVRAGTPCVVPHAMLAAMAEGRLGRLSVRCRFAAQGLEASVLVPCDDAAARARLEDLLASIPEIQWCESAPGFDAIVDERGPHRRWLDPRFHVARGLPCAVAASWLPDWPALRRTGLQQAVVHQINIVHQPPDPEERRFLRKHLARLDLLDEELEWPASRLQEQRRLVERRLASPWLIDELLACESIAHLQSTLTGMQARLCEQGGAALTDDVVRPGDFDELMLTGLDSGRFIAQDAIAGVGRGIVTATLWAALEQRDTANATGKFFDAFISHSTADVAWAHGLCGDLERAGLRCWIARRDIAAGRHYAEVIDDALRQSRAIVLLMSVASMGSAHVLRELERAVHHGAKILPVRLSAIEPSHAFSYLLSGSQWTDALRTDDGPAVVRRLLSALGKVE